MKTTPGHALHADLRDALERIGEAVGVDSGLAEHGAERIAFIERRVEATRDRCDALQQLLPLLGLGVNGPADEARKRIKGLLTAEETINDRLTDEMDRRRDLEAQIVKVTAERDAARARADAAEAKVKRLLRQRRAAYDVLDAVHALDEIAKALGVDAQVLKNDPTGGEGLAADAGFYRIDRPAYLEANQARERIAAHLRLPGATWAQLADAIVAPKPSRLRRALARLARRLAAKEDAHAPKWAEEAEWLYNLLSPEEKTIADKETAS